MRSNPDFPEDAMSRSTSGNATVSKLPFNIVTAVLPSIERRLWCSIGAGRSNLKQSLTTVVPGGDDRVPAMGKAADAP
jgi:hypothetical protein